VLNVRNQEANPAAGCQKRKYRLLKCLRIRRHSGGADEGDRFCWQSDMSDVAPSKRPKTLNYAR